MHIITNMWYLCFTSNIVLIQSQKILFTMQKIKKKLADWENWPTIYFLNDNEIF